MPLCYLATLFYLTLFNAIFPCFLFVFFFFDVSLIFSIILKFYEVHRPLSPFTPFFIFYLSFRTLDIDLEVDTRIQGGEWCSIGHGSRFYTRLYYFKGSL